MNRPEVSIVIPVLDRAALARDAIRSVQDAGAAAEILVVDDGSGDGTLDVLRSLAAGDPRIVLLHGPGTGPAAARNVGIRHASGVFATFHDSDDLSAPGRILRQVGKLKQRPHLAAVVGAVAEFEALDAAGRPHREAAALPHHNAALQCATFRTAVFAAFGLLDEGLRFAEDVDFFLRLIEADAPMLLEAETACFRRIHAHNMTNDRASKHRGYLQAYARSIARRRASGSRRPLQPFFFQPIERDTEIGGGLAWR